MSAPATWQTLAWSVPVLVVFGVVIFFLVRELIKNNTINSQNVNGVIKTFMDYMTTRDTKLTDTMEKVVTSLEKHDDQAKVILQEARGHDQFVRDNFRRLDP